MAPRSLEFHLILGLIGLVDELHTPDRFPEDPLVPGVDPGDQEAHRAQQENDCDDRRRGPARTPLAPLDPAFA